VTIEPGSIRAHGIGPDLVFFDLAVEARTVDAEHVGGLLFVAVALLEGGDILARQTALYTEDGLGLLFIGGDSKHGSSTSRIRCTIGPKVCESLINS